MRKMLVLLAMVLAFSFAAVAQYGSSDSGQSSQKSDKMGKSSTLTGCLSKEPDANGNYTLTNGKLKKGVAVGPADKVKEHAGHTVQLTGSWSGSGDQKMFNVTSLKHISATCSEGGASKSSKSD